MLHDVLQHIAKPGPEYRGAPFWAWNAKLEPEELRRQIRLFKDMGLGGFFMHSRVGLNTPYLSEEWFDCIRACIDEAKRQHMNAWLYDEDRWPSGAAGGLVTRDPQFRQRYLSLTLATTLPEQTSPDTIATFAAHLDGVTASGIRRFRPGQDTLADGETLLIFEDKATTPSSWFNDQTYLDTMNPKAVAKFIETTHEAYKRHIAADFGKTVPGIFTDEPNYYHGGGQFIRPWTTALPAEFSRLNGYDLIDHLPELFFRPDGQTCSKTRLDYYNTATTLYVNAFSRLYGEWCERNHLLFTGHDLNEDDPIAQTATVGAAMRFYEFQQQPGIDLLTEHWGIFDTAKQCSSMAHQFGRRWRLSETYGCTGWDFPFMGHKALGDWQFATGINFRCQHLAWYSMAAEAKRDYPASISYQSPWYKYFGMVEDYFARLGAALDDGEEQRDLLVIHPIESTWFACVLDNPATQDENRAERASLYTLSNQILAANIDFDYGDEEVMSRHASLADDGRLAVNRAAYRAVLIPRLRTIRSSTLRLLAQFRQHGGAVLYLGQPPTCVDGRPSDDAQREFALFQPVRDDELADALSDVARIVSIADPQGRQIAPALHILRKADDHQTLFICNYGVEFGPQMSYPLVRDRLLAWPDAAIRVRANRDDQVFELNLMNGDITPVPATFEDHALAFRTSLERLGSRLFIITPQNIANAAARTAPQLTGATVTLPAQGWSVEPDDFNVLVLDHARYAVNGEPRGKDFILTLDDKLRKDDLGVRPRGGAMVQPWLSAHADAPDKTLDLQLDYTFRCAQLPQSECFFAVERPDLYTFEFNGQPVDAIDRGWWCDISLRRIALPTDAFRIGENVITLRCKYHQYLPGLEMTYLLGDFGVIDDVLTAPVTHLAIGDWCAQGLQNYAGNLVYTHTVELDVQDRQPAVLQLGEWRGVALAVSINGSAWQTLPWPPFELDASPFLRNGRNTIAIRVIGHRRNSHGPFYAKETWPVWTGPGEAKQYIDGPNRKLVPCGLLQPPVLRF